MVKIRLGRDLRMDQAFIAAETLGTRASALLQQLSRTKTS